MEYFKDHLKFFIESKINFLHKQKNPHEICVSKFSSRMFWNDNDEKIIILNDVHIFILNSYAQKALPN